MGSHRQLRRLPTNWSLGLLAVCRQHSKNRHPLRHAAEPRASCAYGWRSLLAPNSARMKSSRRRWARGAWGKCIGAVTPACIAPSRSRSSRPHVRDPEAKLRFDREAKVISSRSHPNICTLYDVGHHDGVDFLVMEYLEGETLAERLRRGALPLEQVLRYGQEICEGLENAHKSGVIHRDLKPGNIMLVKTGAKLMDFGLAKARPPLPPTASSLTATLDPDREPPLTARGTVVGTFQYMSPEQLEGKDADARSDIFALGAVLYEMASGKRAFDGKTVASVIASVLAVAPPAISATQPASPASLDRVVQTCLEKDPDERFQNVHDVKLELKWIAEGDGGGAKAPAPSGSRRIAWAGAALAALAAITLGALQLTRTPEVKYPIRTSIAAPENSTFLFLGDQAGPLALSPDGRKLAFVANPLNDAGKLYIRLLDAAEPTALSGTENATSPFWSPDSRRFAFFCRRQIEARRGNRRRRHHGLRCGDRARRESGERRDDCVFPGVPQPDLSRSGKRRDPSAGDADRRNETHLAPLAFLPAGWPALSVSRD